MGTNAKQIAQRFIGMAQSQPDAISRQDVLRKAAYTFMGLAQDPKNVRASAHLSKIGLDFAAAAMRERPAVANDFQDLLEETHAAIQEVDEEPLDVIARRSEIHDQRTPEMPGNVSIAPRSFNRDATLGRSAMITYAPTNDQIAQGIIQAQNVAFWQGNKHEAQAMTVDASLGALPPPVALRDGSPAAINNRAYVEVEFGSDGNRNKVQFDLGTGRRCTVVGNYIAVTVGMDAPFDGGGGTPYTSQVITAGASIGAFAAPSQAPLIRTVYVDQLDPSNDSDFLAIPIKGTRLLPIQTDIDTLTGGDLIILFYDAGGNELTRYYYQQAYNLPQQEVPMFGDVAFVKVRNNNSRSVNVRLPFQLSL